MTAYSKLQQQEFESEKDGYTAPNIKEKLVHLILMLFQILFLQVKAPLLQ